MTTPLPLAVTMGEPAGIGPEITLTAWARRQEAGMPPFYLIACPGHLEAVARQFDIDVPIEMIVQPQEAITVFSRALPVFALDLAAPIEFGHPKAATADAVIRSIDIAIEHALCHQAAGIVTNPIQKSVLYGAGFHHPGHTEYIADLCARREGTLELVPVMMLAVPSLRVVPVTIHIPLRQVPGALSRDLIADTALRVARALRHDFGIPNPRLAVAGLNPHAGEAGTLGREEIDIIGPAVEEIRARGISVSGPLPADTLFHAHARRQYDTVLCMYHDQALIPLKTIDFDHGVNVTLGLPVVRTSPDHGTALDIAGQGKASPESLMAALDLAADIARRRASAARPA